MDPDLEKILSQPAPPPSAKAEEEAWLKTASEFHRAHRQHKTQNHSPSWNHWIWPLTAAAAIVVFCAVLLPNDREVSVADNTRPASTDIEQIYRQGRQLFGNKLQAVSLSQDNLVWHLTDQPQTPATTDQLVTLVIHQEQAPDLHIATIPGAPIDINYQGQTHQVEFLPQVNDQIIAYGNNLYWDSNGPDSPIRETSLHYVNR